MQKVSAIALWACLLLAGLQPPPVRAGAWLEAQGQGFLASALRARDGGEEYSSYAAYGLTPGLTLGLDLNRRRDAGGEVAHALVFARLPLRQAETGWQLASELSLGLARQGSAWQPMQRLTLSAGRGIRVAGQSGWLAFDLTREAQWQAGADAWKLDTALGLHSRRGQPAPMLQVEIYHPDQGRSSWAVLPALRFSLSERRDVLTGLELRSGQTDRLGLRIALWHRF